MYLRSGVALSPVGGGSEFRTTLQTGWEINGGGRVLFFNQSEDAAWTVDLGISDIENHGRRPEQSFDLHHIIVPDPLVNGSTITVPTVPVTVRQLNRTFGTFGLGREWYLVGTARGEGPTWRFGIDLDGHYGSARLDLNELRHRTKVLYGLFIAWHTDVEIPCGGCLLQAGFRSEWGYTWQELLQSQNNTDLAEFNLLLTAGIRF
jgi:hypothetical protein